MNIDAVTFLHDVTCGALAAAGFGVLFNIGFKALPWCAASGAFALAIRSIALGLSWRLEAASFVAALALASLVLLLPSSNRASRSALRVVGCIPMIPGALAAKAILGLFAMTAQPSGSGNEAVVSALTTTFRVVFTIGALGTGLAIPMLLIESRTNTHDR